MNLAWLEYLLVRIYCWVMAYTNPSAFQFWILVNSYSSFDTLLQYPQIPLETLINLPVMSLQSIPCPPGLHHIIFSVVCIEYMSSILTEPWTLRRQKLVFISLCICPVPDTIPATYKCWWQGAKRQGNDVLWNNITFLMYEGMVIANDFSYNRIAVT